MPAWLVTGGSGFLGRHLLAALAAHRPEDRVVALGRRRPEGVAPDRFVSADLADPSGLAAAVAEAAPDLVVHAAGRTPPADPADFERDNVGATRNLLGALETLGRPVRAVLVGSAAELGPVDPSALPVGEDHPCRPVGAYAESKHRATLAGLAARPPVEVMVARVFNPTGPGLPASQAFGRFARELARPGPDPLRLAVGGLEARRDFVDARDVACALIALVLAGRPATVYHVGTGRSHPVGEGLDLLIGLSGRRVIVEPDPALGTGGGPADSRADVRRIAEHAGWRAEIPFERSLADLWAAASRAVRCG